MRSLRFPVSKATRSKYRIWLQLSSHFIRTLKKKRMSLQPDINDLSTWRLTSRSQTQFEIYYKWLRCSNFTDEPVRMSWLGLTLMMFNYPYVYIYWRHYHTHTFTCSVHPAYLSLFLSPPTLSRTPTHSVVGHLSLMAAITTLHNQNVHQFRPPTDSP